MKRPLLDHNPKSPGPSGNRQLAQKEKPDAFYDELSNNDIVDLMKSLKTQVLDVVNANPKTGIDGKCLSSVDFFNCQATVLKTKVLPRIQSLYEMFHSLQMIQRIQAHALCYGFASGWTIPINMDLGISYLMIPLA